MSRTHLETTAYLQIEPRDFRSWDKDDNGNPLPSSATITTVTQRRPTAKRNSVVVKVRFKIPIGVFMPLQPEAVIEIPESLVMRNSEVTLVGEDANPPEED